MWMTPKTDWAAEDTFDLHPDYLRIKNNILEVKQLAGKMYPAFPILHLADYGFDATGFADFFNNIEDSLELLAANTFRPPDFQPIKHWKENAAIWKWEDLNRIEGGLAGLYQSLRAQEDGKQTIAFTLGGGLFATAI